MLRWFTTLSLQKYLSAQKSRGKTFLAPLLLLRQWYGLSYLAACTMAGIVSYEIIDKKRQKEIFHYVTMLYLPKLSFPAESTISLENLKQLFTRPIFIIYFSALNILTFSGLVFAIWSRYILSDDSKKRNSQLFVGIKPKHMRRIVGLMFSLEGGMLASETLLLAKSG